MLLNMETRVRCTHVQSNTSELDWGKYSHNSCILWWNDMKLGGYVLMVIYPYYVEGFLSWDVLGIHSFGYDV
jgi:hypothetical protein